MKRLSQLLVLVAAWEPQADSECFGITSPGIGGAHSAGDTLSHAVEQLREVVLFHTEESPITQDDLFKLYDPEMMLLCTEELDECWWRYVVMEAWVEESVEFDFNYLQLRDRFRDIEKELLESMAEMKQPRKS